MLLNLEENKIEFKSKYSDSLFAELKNFLDSNKDSVTLLSFEKMYNGITKTNTLKEFNVLSKILTLLLFGALLA